MRIEAIQTFRLSLPLHEPYRLSYGAIDALTSVWVRAELSDGGVGWGESTPLPGYSDSDIDAVWHATNVMADACIGREVASVLRSPHEHADGFLFTAVWTALEEATGSIPRLAGKVPLVGITQEKAHESPGSALQRVRSAGYRVFKVKVGFGSIERDFNRLSAFQQELEDGERIRVDANQALSEDEASFLLKGCIPGKMELFEQPLPVEAWKECSRLARLAPVPIMLDEAITGLDTLEQAARAGASIVKLKLMKQGGISHLQAMVDRAKELGLKVVLGNGVAGWIDNRHEAAFWLAHLHDSGLAGEMNGHLKIDGEAPWASIRFENGGLRLAGEPSCDIDVNRYPVIAKQVHRARHPARQLCHSA